MIQPFLRSDVAKIRFLFQYYALLKSIISFKGKDLWAFSDGKIYKILSLLLKMAYCNLYVEVWTKILPYILQSLKNGGGSYNLNPELFLNVGNRKSSGYGFRLDIVNGDIPRKDGSAVARDLKIVLDSCPEFKSLTRNKTITVRMGKNFDMHIIL